MIYIDDQALSFIVRRFSQASERAHLCVAHYDTTGKDSDRCAALFAIGEASGIRNLLLQVMRKLPTEVAADMHSLDQEITRLTYVGVGVSR